MPLFYTKLFKEIYILLLFDLYFCSENNSGSNSESHAASSLETVLQNNYKILFDKELYLFK